MIITKSKVKTTIQASKIYKNSKYKSRINANMESPINKELIVQLADLISTPTVDVSKQSPSDVSTNPIAPSDQGTENNAPMPSGEFTSNGIGSISKSASDAMNKIDEIREDMGETEPSSEPSTEPTESTESETSTTEEVEEATKIQGKPIMAAMQSTLINDSLDSIMGLLNADAETSGVIRAAITDSELWLYYNDNTNLNNVMESVISRLNSASYTTLEFNRLARSNNAMVFTCLDQTTPVKTVVRN